jgi:hypothetical protein
MSGCFLVIGLIWPTVINVIVYGRLTRPPEVKAQMKAAKAAKKKRDTSAEDLAKLAAMSDALEAKLKAGAGDRAAVETTVKTEQPVKELTAKELEMAQVSQQQEEKHYGAKADDFYPVERRDGHKEE